MIPSETLPSRNRDVPVSPRDPTTTRSARSASATFTISWLGWPCTTAILASKPAFCMRSAACVATARAFLSRGVRNCSRNDARVCGASMASIGSGGTTDTTVISAGSGNGSLSRYSTPAQASFEPSIATTIRLNTGTGFLINRTGQPACITTFLDTLPSRKARTSVRPREPITIRSAFCLSAVRTIASAGCPRMIRQSTLLQTDRNAPCVRSSNPRPISSAMICARFIAPCASPPTSFGRRSLARSSTCTRSRDDPSGKGTRLSTSTTHRECFDPSSAQRTFMLLLSTSAEPAHRPPVGSRRTPGPPP